MKIIKIIVDELPKSCAGCILENCNLPMAKTRSRLTDGIIKKYTTKRHEQCILEQLESSK